MSNGQTSRVVRIRDNVISAVIAMVIVFLVGFVLERASSGVLIRLLGGATAEELEAVEAKSLNWSAPYQQFGLFDRGEQDVPVLPASIVSGQPAPPYRQPMIPVNEGVCFLTDIRGNFNGDLERVYIEDVDGVWQLSAYTKLPGMRVFARCWEFQRLQAEAN